MVKLISSRRLFTEETVYNAPHTFLFVSLLVSKPNRHLPVLDKHLVCVLSCYGQWLLISQNDYIFASYYHDPQTGFANLDESSEWISDVHSSSSVIRHTPSRSSSAFITQQVCSHVFPPVLTSPGHFDPPRRIKRDNRIC